MMHPENPALPALFIRAPDVPETIEYELGKVREDIELSCRRWRARRESELRAPLPESRDGAGEWQIIQVRTGVVPQRITLTEVVTTPFFCTAPANGLGPAVRAKVGHPWHTWFRAELGVLAACNTTGAATSASEASRNRRPAPSSSA